MSIAVEPRKIATDLAPYRQQILRRLAEIRRQVRAHLALDGLARTLGTVVLLAAASLLFDWMLRFNLSTRIGLLVLGLATIAVVAYRWLLTPLSLGLDDLDLAQLLDRRSPGVGERMAGVMQLPELLDGRAQASPSMVAAAVREHAAALERADLGALLNVSRRRKLQAAIAALVLAIVAFAVLFPVTSELWARRWLLGSNVRWPQHNYLSVVGLGHENRLLAPRGEPLLLQVDAQPRFEQVDEGWQLLGRGEPLIIEKQDPPEPQLPDAVSLRYSASTGVKQGNFTHFSEANFRFELPPLIEPIDVSITGGDDWLAPVRIEPIDRPTVESLTLVARPLGSTSDQTHRVGESDEPLLFLEKTQLELRMVSKEPLASAQLTSKGDAFGRFTRIDDRTYTARWEMKEPLTLELRLVGQSASLSSKPYFITIGLLTDREPRVTLRSTGVGRRITPQARLPLVIRALDDFGVALLAVDIERSEFKDNKPQSTTDRLELEKFDATKAELPTELEKSQTVPLKDYNLAAGTAIKLRAGATDNCPLGQHTGHSRWLNFQVVTPEELFYEILMRQRDQRGRFAVATKSARAQSEALTVAEKPEDVAGLVRTHQVIARQSWQVANQLDATLLEMTLNDLSTSQARDLLSEKVIAPLRALHEDQLSRLGNQLQALASAAEIGDTQRAAAGELQDETIKAMQRILDQMSQWESFVDVTNQLRQIIKLQDQVLESTEDLRKTRTDELFDK